MANTEFQGELAGTMNNVNAMLKKMREAKTCWPCCSRPRFISWLCCCMSGFEYYGFSKVRKIATPLAEKTEKLTANFSLSLNLSGNAAVSGNTGTAVGVDNTYIANVRSASNDTILQDHYTGKDQQHRTPTQI